ncbi:spore coat protein A [Actinoalloteichus hoggarensis]|uniref:Spore coat protein A n=1 Tax=Actinoalloteichus hoggarensis TaxID=1470176 RepID=A0A221W7A5_9PSEU|nr:multicopper oxidase family protein [Actinoalloteichus hoggarensis]ASO21247.1 Spore coat protein A [Actinoalloteichus hoggarensis]MBB5921179.1 spore coat protein A [Actinoalloteichus hoggarensis]
MTSLTRRNLLRGLGIGAVGAAIGVPLVSGIAGSDSTGLLLSSRLPLPPPFQLPLAIPPVLAPVRTDAAADHYALTQRATTVEILPGVQTEIWGYDGRFPGPTIVSRRGRRTVVRHRNELPVPAVVHLHGGHTPPEHDGYPIDLILPVGMSAGPGRGGAVLAEGERAYDYPLDQRAATLWYHDHRMDFTAPSVWRGLAGFHLVTDEEEDALPLPRGERDLPLMITDRSFAADGTLHYPSLDPTLTGRPGVREPYAGGVLGDVILVNGVPWPLAEVRAARYRLRLLNASNARRYRLALDPPPPGGGGLVQIGTDAGLLAAPVRHDAVELAPAQRYDVIVDFGRYRPGTEVTLVDEFGADSTASVLRFRVGECLADDTAIPERLSEIVPLNPADAVVTRTLRFQSTRLHGMSGWTVNGRPFHPDEVHAEPRLGNVEIWRLISDFHHPVHLHLSPFQVLSRGTGGPGPYDHGWKDTVDVRPGEEVAIIVRFERYAGRYVFHCHNLEHEDMMMMANFVAVE